MHKRFFPRQNAFRYRVYYLCAPLSQLAQYRKGLLFGVNRPGILSFYDKDHGARDTTPLADWARGLLHAQGLSEASAEIVLVTMPRVLGYGFNPVSFWLCLDDAKQLRAVISEVSNTFGEYHCYLTARADHAPLQRDDVLACEKLFHVSPFIKREGSYTFRFDYQPEQGRLGVWIHYFDSTGACKLITSMVGHLEPYSTRSLLKALGKHPLVTLKVISLIHWQAIKLVRKSVRYIRKPAQTLPNISSKITNSSSSGHPSVTESPL